MVKLVKTWDEVKVADVPNLKDGINKMYGPLWSIATTPKRRDGSYLMRVRFYTREDDCAPAR
jgi:hypothetical protein